MVWPMVDWVTSGFVAPGWQVELGRTPFEWHVAASTGAAAVAPWRPSGSAAAAAHMTMSRTAAPSPRAMRRILRAPEHPLDEPRVKRSAELEPPRHPSRQLVLARS